MRLQRAAIMGLILCISGAEGAQPPSLHCNLGPIEKTYGGTEWNVYGCDDRQSVAIITAPGNPATPFIFFFSHNSGGYQLHGEGTGDKKITDKAYNELAALTELDIAALAAEASHH